MANELILWCMPDRGGKSWLTAMLLAAAMLGGAQITPLVTDEVRCTCFGCKFGTTTLSPTIETATPVGMALPRVGWGIVPWVLRAHGNLCGVRSGKCRPTASHANKPEQAPSGYG